MPNPIIQVQHVSKSYWRDSFEVTRTERYLACKGAGKRISRLNGACRFPAKPHCSFLLPTSEMGRAKEIFLLAEQMFPN